MEWLDLNRKKLDMENTRFDIINTPELGLYKLPLLKDFTEVGEAVPTLRRSDIVIVKHLKIDDNDMRQRFVEANAILKTCNHKNIVCVFFCDQIMHEPFVAMEKGEQSVADVLYSKDKYPTDRVGNQSGHYTMSHCISWMHQVTDALSYLHERRIVHRDVKGANILLFDESTRCKLCDFDDCRYIKAKMSAEVGTPTHMAPELAKINQRNHYKEYNEKCDCYSFGATILEMIFRSSPNQIPGPNSECRDAIVQFWNGCPIECIEVSLRKSVFDFDAHEKEFAVIKKILDHCLQDEPAKRLPANQIFAQLETLATESIPPLLPPIDGDSLNPNQYRAGQTTKSSRMRSLYVAYRVSLFSGMFDEKLESQVERVLNALGNRVNTKAADSPDQDYTSVEHSFKAVGGTGSQVLTIEHGIGGPDYEAVEAVREFCRLNSDSRHTNWLASLFMEDNCALLRKLTFAVLSNMSEE